MQIFDVEQLLTRAKSDAATLEPFFAGGSLRLATAHWPTGSLDDQAPHTDDEVYYVVSGRATLRAGDEDREVGPGTIVYIPSGLEHHFHSINEDLSVLVIFGSGGRAARVEARAHSAQSRSE